MEFCEKIRKIEGVIRFTTHQWEKDAQWKDYMKNAVLDNLSQEELEQIKRVYYQQQIDPNLEKYFEFKDGEERKAFIQTCKYYQVLGTLGVKRDPSEKASSWKKIRRTLYFLYLLTLPLMQFSYSPLIYVGAILVTLKENQIETGETSLLKGFLNCEEELLNIVLVILLLFSATFLRILLHLCLGLWAFLQCCDWAFELLRGNEDFVGLAPLKPLIFYGVNNKLELTQYKNHLEVFICAFSILGFLFGYSAPIFPLFYSQILRIKYSINPLTAHSCTLLDQKLLQAYLPSFFYSSVVARLKNWLSNIGAEEEAPKDKAD